MTLGPSAASPPDASCSTCSCVMARSKAATRNFRRAPLMRPSSPYSLNRQLLCRSRAWVYTSATRSSRVPMCPASPSASTMTCPVTTSAAARLGPRP
ncbi:hypothetical protein TSOC_011294 [Tetrabaena socialis]|uniref:Uncharacterized protein n=1 Tax=Tetrabaena socialis TaxID=47790 RepID=A0A2J7ZR25_9CHLO|nr:hypothetical protein TSOC_011294 [Tetrabaena socialis]|eukprot:PNH02700.1 hypothetical protein TSOC_011294 [Tetrabaena socialis]